MAFTIPQSTFGQYPAVAIQGQRADLSPVSIESGILTVAASPGLGLIAAAAPVTTAPLGSRSVKLPTASFAVGVFAGVGLYDPAWMVAAGSATTWAAKDCPAIMRKGRIWVLVNGTVADGDPAYCVYTTDLGQFRADNTAAVSIPGIFRSAATAGNIAILELNCP